MTARQIKFGGPDNAPEPTEVYLYEHKYLLRRVTRSVQKAIEKVDKDIYKMFSEGDPDSDKIVGKLAEGIAEVLGMNGTDPEPPSPKKLIVEKWKADEIDLAELRRLFDDLQEAATARPT